MINLQGFINFVFKLTHLPLSCPPYSDISKRDKMINVAFRTKIQKIIQH
ncbi:Mobile element protein [Candidatus Enterovibrio altilux]|uniref:Mobile element protein n=1 Tax=Candidatus Enterovibrio altilux TaxID=1927128 RepID=A0A291B6M5_9GAMM|nr:Mobile element protein [Candidatus Enterovibrio luxaltus]